MSFYLRLLGLAAFIIAILISLGLVVPTLFELSIVFSLFVAGVCWYAAACRIR